MTYAAEQTFRAAVIAAEGTKQQSISAAKTTYGFVAANSAAYVTALGDADAAYQSAVVTALAALNETPGNVGLNGPIAGAGWTPICPWAF